METNLKIFCDFDGTITLNDIWRDAGGQFIKDKEEWYSIIRKFENLEIGVRECFIREAELVENFDVEKFNEILDTQKIDSRFDEFLIFCTNNSLEPVILSEGLEQYIGRILKNHGINLKYYANRLVLSGNKKTIRLEFPYSDSECLKCGCCKRNLMLNMTGDDEISVYIGDEISDGCPAGYADIVFAKKSLASYCWKNNITYFEYKDFRDIKNKLEKILTKKNLKHRQRAKLKRREVFLSG